MCIRDRIIPDYVSNDLPAQLLTSKRPQHFFSDVLGSPALCFDGLRADVGGDDHIGVRHQGSQPWRFLDEYIKGGPGYLA